MSDSPNASFGIEPEQPPVEGGTGSFTHVTVELPVTEFVLAETLLELRSAEFDCESAVHCGGTVMPLVWAAGAGRDELERTIADDPSVRTASIVEEHGDRLLFHVEWGEHVSTRIDILTTGDAVMRAARGSVEGWTFELLYPSRTDLAEAYATCERCNVDLDFCSIRELTPGSEDRYGLSDQQRDALATAHEYGYFEVPRDADLDDVAEELDISHQSLSERLRRGHDALIEHTIRKRDR